MHVCGLAYSRIVHRQHRDLRQYNTRPDELRSAQRRIYTHRQVRHRLSARRRHPRIGSLYDSRHALTGHRSEAGSPRGIRRRGYKPLQADGMRKRRALLGLRPHPARLLSHQKRGIRHTHRQKRHKHICRRLSRNILRTTDHHAITSSGVLFSRRRRPRVIHPARMRHSGQTGIRMEGHAHGRGAPLLPQRVRA